MELIHLIGSDDVRVAGGRMQAAADDIRSSAATIQYAVDRLADEMREHRDRMNDWLDRFENIVTQVSQHGDTT